MDSAFMQDSPAGLRSIATMNTRATGRHRLHLIHCHHPTNGIAKPVHNGAEIGNAIHRHVVCKCEDKPSGTLHILLPNSVIVEPSVGQQADVLDRPHQILRRRGGAKFGQ